MSFWSAILSAIIFFWELFKMGLYVAVVPFTHKDTIWIIVPIWLSWVFAEFFQEKEGTSFGNAISNGVVPLWVGIDWARQITSQLSQSKFTLMFFGKYVISALVLIYGFVIIIGGIRGKEFVRYFGRIREVTYVLAALTPFIYGLIKPDYKYFLAIIIFFIPFYILIEIIDRMIPESEAFKIDKMEKGEKQGGGEFQQQELGEFPPLR